MVIPVEKDTREEYSHVFYSQGRHYKYVIAPKLTKHVKTKKIKIKKAVQVYNGPRLEVFLIVTFKPVYRKMKLTISKILGQKNVEIVIQIDHHQLIYKGPKKIGTIGRWVLKYQNLINQTSPSSRKRLLIEIENLCTTSI